jgi:hypothetical protein
MQTRAEYETEFGYNAGHPPRSLSRTPRLNARFHDAHHVYLP